MAKDFLDRKLTLDTNPVGEKTRATWNEARLSADHYRPLNWLPTLVGNNHTWLVY